MAPQQLGLGYIVWWSLPDDVRISRTQWEKMFPDFPLPTEPLGDPLRRALYSIEAPKGTKRLIRPLQARDEWALVIETPSTTDALLTYKVELAVKLTRGGLEFIKTRSGYEEVERQLRKNYLLELERISSGAIADLILDHIRGTCLAVQARKAGGVYFVGIDYKSSLEKAWHLVEGLHGSLYQFAVGDTSPSRKDLIKLVIEDLRNSVELARANFAARHKTDAITEGKRALDRVQFYTAALGLAAEEASKVETELNELLVTALTKKEKREESDAD